MPRCETEQAILKESPEKAKKAAKTAGELGGELAGAPANQIEKTAEGLLELYEGKLKNPADLLLGPPPKK